MPMKVLSVMLKRAGGLLDRCIDLGSLAELSVLGA
jgi:hypothetical protein